MEFRDMVIGEDEEVTSEKVETLDSLWTSALEEAVNDRFKESGRTIDKGKKKESLNPFEEVFKK